MLRNMAYASVSAASAGLLLILFVVAGRTLGDVEFGKFSFALALGTIFETLMDFGLHQATIRAVARDRSQATALLHHTLGIKLIWGAVALLALAAWLTNAQFGGIGVRFDRAIWRELQTTALPLGFFLVVLNLYSYVDGVMLGVMRGNVETGFYAAAYRTYEGMTYLPSIIAAVLTPRLADLFVRDRREHRRLALGGFGAAIGLAVLVGGLAYTLATPLLVLLFGGEFRAAAEPFRILCIGLPLVFGIWFLHAITMSLNRARLPARTAVV